MPRARVSTVGALAEALAGGLDLDPGADRSQAAGRLLGLPGIGSWTAGYVAMRALGDTDVLLTGDLAVRNAVTRLGGSAKESELNALAEGWRPWRSYANVHLWASLSDPAPKEATK